MAKAKASHYDQVVKAVTKKPITAGAVGQKLGFGSHHGVSKALGQAVKNGDVVKTDKGYQKAA